MVTPELKSFVEDFGLLMKEDTDPFGVTRLYADVKGNNVLYVLSIGIEPQVLPYRLVRIQQLILRPDLEDIDMPVSWLISWINSKNSDLNFGRYYLDQDNKLNYEVAIPVVNGEICWSSLDEVLRIAVFSVDDAMDQLLTLSAAIKGGET